MASVLIVDDDPKLLRMLGRTLSYEGFHVLSASNGNEALGEIQAHRPDVVVLDWMMPGMDGLTVLEKLRNGGDRTLVLMLTARDAVENRVAGLEGGADDYLVKPFAPAELLARIHALLRRPSAAPKDETLAYSDLKLNPPTREVTRGLRRIDLTAKEFELLRYLLRHPRQVLSRDQILQEVWGYDFGGEDNVLEVYVGYLRKKTEAAGEPRLIQTVRGVGYTLRNERVTTVKASAPRRGISIRLRLTLLYTAILAVTLVAFGSILYLAQSQSSYDAIRFNLAREAGGYVRRLSLPFPAPPGGAPDAGLPERDSAGPLDADTDDRRRGRRQNARPDRVRTAARARRVFKAVQAGGELDRIRDGGRAAGHDLQHPLQRPAGGSGHPPGGTADRADAAGAQHASAEPDRGEHRGDPPGVRARLGVRGHGAGPDPPDHADRGRNRVGA